MPVMSLTLLGLAILILICGSPVAVALGFASALVIFIYKPVPDMMMVPQLLCEASTSFTLLAVPLFILAGNLMEKGSVGRNLIDWCTSVVGWMTGGLGAVNIVGSMIFGGISGSSLADTATFGSILVPRMVDDGYDRDYAGAVTLTSSCLSVVIPPSILIVLAAAATQQSVSRALAAGLMPGILITALLMIPNYIICKKYGYGTKIPFSLKNVWAKTKTCWTAIVAPLIILGSIFSGVVTPTEGAAVACLYVLFIDGVIYRKFTMKDIISCLEDAAVLTGCVLFIATSSAVMNFVISFEGIPTLMSNALMAMPGGKIGFLILLDVFLIIIGMTVDANPATLIFTPLLLPVATQMGIDPSHFIIICVVGFAVGLTTPPYGVCLFSISSVCNIPMDRLVKKAIPFYVVLFGCMFLVTFIEPIATFLPTLFGM
ncbi:MAG: TRAP transporter large permease [Eubacteriales bacterium]|jgi:tripartite ATP-independent transporter DctM subunit